MSDLIYLVTRDEQDQYVRLLDLSDSTSIYALRDTFRPVLAGRQPSIATADSRRGGAVQVAERRDTATVGGTFMVKGTTSDEALTRAESLLAQEDSAARSRWVWWQPDGATHVSLYPLIGPATTTVNYAWAQFASGFSPIEVSWPCQSWAEGLVQDMSDDFRARDIGLTALAQFQRDYTTTVVPTSVAKGALELALNLASASTSKIARLDRQPWRDGTVWAKGKAKTGSTSSSIVNTPGLRYTPADGKFIFAQLTATTLSVQEWDGAVFQTRASVAQAAPAVGTSFWVRIRAEGDTVTAEYWTTEPSAVASPTNSTAWTNAASIRTGYPLAFSRGPGGASGNTPIIERVKVEPYSWRLVNTPALITTEPLPGKRETAVDLDIATSTGDADWPRALTLAWRRAKTGSAGSGATSMLIQAESFAEVAGDITPTVVTDTALYRGASGQGLQFSLTNANALALARYPLDATIFEPDDFSEECVVAVIVRYRRSSTSMVQPRLRAHMGSGPIIPAAVNALFPSYTPEFGITGRYIPLIGTGVRSTVLGTLALPTKYPEPVSLLITVAWSAGTTAATLIVLDEIYVVPLRSLAMSATGKARDDGTYATLMQGNGYTRRIYANRSSEINGTDTAGVVPALWRAWPLNLGGADLLLPAGSDGLGAELLVRPAAAVTDDPVTNASDILAHNASVHLRVTPRYHLFAA